MQKKYALVKQVKDDLWKSYRDHRATNAVSVEHCAMYCRMISFPSHGDALCQLFMYDPGTKRCHVGNRGLTSNGSLTAEHDVYFDPSTVLHKKCYIGVMSVVATNTNSNYFIIFNYLIHT